MKRFLTILLALPIAATAQKLQLGLNAGTQYNLPSAYGTVKGRVNGYASARVLTHLGRHLQLGFTVDVGKITLGSSDAIYTDESQTNTNGLVYIIASPYIMPAAIINYKIGLPKTICMAGHLWAT
ncbi:MAG: hypothetical protein EOP56_12225 [Sphingobacteriales bacterium]|nr:MAG: hypothetical protein EOP56_12225 [Sphingobacteriales bacterium]